MWVCLLTCDHLSVTLCFGFVRVPVSSYVWAQVGMAWLSPSVQIKGIFCSQWEPLMEFYQAAVKPLCRWPTPCSATVVSFSNNFPHIRLGWDVTYVYLYHREGVSLHLSARRHTTAVCRGKDLDIFSPLIKVCEGVPNLVDPLLVLGRSWPQGYRSAGKRYGAQASCDSQHDLHHCQWGSTEADRAVAYQNCLSGRSSGMYKQQQMYQGKCRVFLKNTKLFLFGQVWKVKPPKNGGLLQCRFSLSPHLARPRVVVWPSRLVQTKQAFGSGLYRGVREGIALIFVGKSFLEKHPSE